jgi:preprotein translocase subunit SecD
MPVLNNPRWERFAQLIVSYVAKPGEPNSHGKLYAQAGYNPNGVGQGGGAAEANASRLIKKDIVRNRVNELLAEVAKTTKVTIQSITEEYDEAREHARKLDQTSTMLAASQAKAKLYKLETTVIENINAEANMPQNSEEIAIELLRDVGLESPDDETKRRALEAYDLMIATLEAIRDEELGLTTYQHRPHTPVSKHEH